MSQKIKAPNEKGGNGFLWTIVAILVIAVVVIGVIVTRGNSSDAIAEEMPQDEVQFEATAGEDYIELASADVDKDAPLVEIYEDFSCPHCADLTEADHEDSTKALNEGKVKIRYRFLNFLDDGRDGPSTRGASVAYAVGETGNAKAFWNMFKHMMFEQSTVARTWDYEELSEAASAYDLDDSLIEAIENGDVEDKGKEVAESNGARLEKAIGKVSSPVVMHDGEEYDIKGDADGKPMSWVPDLVPNL